MRAVIVMFDSLNRAYLPPYGAEDVHAPNFERLAEMSVAFDRCYAGSMPCIPARREMHTGRYNFLHRSWGPVEPFDDSVPQMLGEAGVYTHLVTDHKHYWADGGATYHARFNTYEFFRGQQGDPWKGHVADPETPEDAHAFKGASWRQDWINRSYMPDESQHNQTLTFDAGLEFIDTNAEEDNWLLQIETFDPHEPFFSHDSYKALYSHDYDGPHFDWPDYMRVIHDRSTVDHVRAEYAALLSMCDASLGRVLDKMDELDMWDDTMLLVCTDHGFLLGEHGWWGKNVVPWYDETIHTPLFLWDPRTGVRNERRDQLVQTIDFGPTMLEFFDVDRTPDMQGQPLREVIESDVAIRDGALFGAFGAHVNVTDGRYVYMRSSATPQNGPLFEYTLMPTHMRSRFTPPELAAAELAAPFDFTKGIKTLRVPGVFFGNPYLFGTLLFDLENDPQQMEPLQDDDLEMRMAELMVRMMRSNDAPPEQFERMGLPAHGDVTSEHLLIERQWEQVQASLLPPPKADEFGEGKWVLTTPLGELLGDAATKEILTRHLPWVVHGGPLLEYAGQQVTLIELAAASLMLSREMLAGVANEASALRG